MFYFPAMIAASAFLARTALADVAGDLLVTDPNHARIIEVNPATGVQTVFASGGYLQSPVGIAIGNSGAVVVSDNSNNRIISINPTTGAQTLITSLGATQRPLDIAVSPTNGNIIVAEATDNGGPGEVMQVNPITGNTIVVSSGGNFITPWGIAIQANGSYLIGNRGSQASSNDGSLIVVNPTTGAQTVLVGSGSLLWTPDHEAIGVDGSIFVADHDAPDGSGEIFNVNPTTGAQSLVSSGGYFDGGPGGIAIANDGTLFVSETNGGEILGINPDTGGQTVITSGGYFSSGIYGVGPEELAVVPVPEPAPLGMLLVGGAALLRRRASLRNGYGSN